MVCCLFFMALMPMAASVPIRVERIADRNVICIVVRKADIIFSSWKQLLYQSSVNPPQTTRVLELLNERMISTMIGRYRNRKIKNI